MLSEDFSLRIDEGETSKNTCQNVELEETVIHSGFLYISSEQSGSVWVRRWCKLTRSSFVIATAFNQREKYSGDHFNHCDLLLILFEDFSTGAIGLKYRNILLHIRAASKNEAMGWINSISVTSRVPAPPILSSDTVLEASLADSNIRYEEFKIVEDVSLAHRRESEAMPQSDPGIPGKDKRALRERFIRHFKGFCEFFRKNKDSKSEESSPS